MSKPQSTFKHLRIAHVYGRLTPDPNPCVNFKILLILMQTFQSYRYSTKFDAGMYTFCNYSTIQVLSSTRDADK